MQQGDPEQQPDKSAARNHSSGQTEADAQSSQCHSLTNYEHEDATARYAKGDP